MSVRDGWTMLALLLLGCSPGPFSCPADPSVPLPSVDEVCAHIEAIGCVVEEDPLLADAGIDPSCPAGYADVARAVPAPEFERILRCYMAADRCEDLEGCNQACGPDGGRISYRPGVDAGPIDAGTDAGPDDAGPDDAGPDDAGTDAGTDAGPTDAGADAGTVDAGPTDAGSDAGPDAA